MISEINANNYTDFTNEEGLSIIKIGAEWCGPCRMVAPILEEVSDSPISKNIHIGDMDADLDINGSKVQELNIRSIPTTIFYKSGEEINRYVGAYTKPQLEEMIKTYLK